MLRVALQFSVSALVLLSSAACTTGCGGVHMEARAGRVMDRETGAPIAGADVFQMYRGDGVAGEPRPIHLLRSTTADSEGAFTFEATSSDEVRSWHLSGAPEYAFFHPGYGLVREGSPDGPGPITLTGTRLAAARHRAEMLSICGSRPPDALVAEVARSHCDAAIR